MPYAVHRVLPVPLSDGDGRYKSEVSSQSFALRRYV